MDKRQTSCPLDFTLMGQLKHARDEQNNNYWCRPRWAIWKALPVPGAGAGVYSIFNFSGVNGQTSYTNSSGTNTTLVTAEPDSLEEEYWQLQGWYAWSQATQSPSTSAYWDNAQIMSKNILSITAVQNAIKSENDLAPQ